MTQFVLPASKDEDRKRVGNAEREKLLLVLTVSWKNNDCIEELQHLVS